MKYILIHTLKQLNSDYVLQCRNQDNNKEAAYV